MAADLYPESDSRWMVGCFAIGWADCRRRSIIMSNLEKRCLLAKDFLKEPSILDSYPYK